MSRRTARAHTRGVAVRAGGTVTPKISWFAWGLILTAGLLAPATTRAAPSVAASTVPARVTDAERALQGRLMAPCCWAQTLDVHESEISTQLRVEIHERLGRGETADALEDDHCTVCARMAPVLDDLVRVCDASDAVLRVRLEDPSGAGLASRYGVRVVPTIVSVDAAGAEVERRVGEQSRDELSRAIGEVRGRACGG